MKKYSTIKDTEQFKLDDSSSYDSYADDYHRCVDRLCEPFVKQMVTLARLKQGQRVLDVGTGTGIVANHAARLLDDSGMVVGIDLSEGMLETSTLDAKEKGISNVQFIRMDAENLALPTEYFDTVFSMYAIDHFPNAAQALKEMCRVLKYAGCIVVAVGSRLPPWGCGRLRAFGVGVNREIKHRFQPHLYAPNFINRLMNRHFDRLPAPPHSDGGGGADQGKNLALLIKKAGFTVKNMFWKHNMIPIGSTDEFWRSQISLVTEVRKRLQYADAESKKALYKEFKALSDRALGRGGKLFYGSAVYMVKGIKE